MGLFVKVMEIENSRVSLLLRANAEFRTTHAYRPQEPPRMAIPISNDFKLNYNRPGIGAL